MGHRATRIATPPTRPPRALRAPVHAAKDFFKPTKRPRFNDDDDNDDDDDDQNDRPKSILRPTSAEAHGMTLLRTFLVFNRDLHFF
mmetsp:Transcript_34094/g.119212  ORF Transcript_34094/g.119212 Transcript_34094/m.119212 type:complete len:86 (-) Transcript_34094:35-292(-)